MKNILIILLSSLLIGNLLHFDSHHDSTEGYFFCSVDCDDNKHHSFHHNCEKCLNKNIKTLIKKPIEIASTQLESLNHIFNQDLNYKKIIFNLYSRPPPDIL